MLPGPRLRLTSQRLDRRFGPAMPAAQTLSSPSSIPLERPSCSLLIWAETEETLRPELGLIPHPTSRSRVQPPQRTSRHHLLRFKLDHNPARMCSSVKSIPPVTRSSTRPTLQAAAQTLPRAWLRMFEASCT